MSAIEETGKVASGVVAGLKSQPLALALVVVNCLFLAVGVWTIREAGKAGAEWRRMVIDMASACKIVPAAKPERDQ